MSEHLVFCFKAQDGLAVASVPAETTTIIISDGESVIMSQGGRAMPMMIPEGEDIESVSTADLIIRVNEKKAVLKAQNKLAKHARPERVQRPQYRPPRTTRPDDADPPPAAPTVH